jgi:tape measure domain-containing protein
MDVERVVVRLLGDAAPYNRVMAGVEARLISFVQNVSGIGGLLSVPFVAAAGAVTAMGTAMAASGLIAIKLAADYQRIQVAFEVMTGSAEQAKSTIADITQLAIETPFRSTELLENAKQLKAFGVATDQILPTLRALGDVSSGTGSQLDRIVLAFGQVKVAGRLMGPEARQFINAGVPIYEYVGKATGRPTYAIKRLIEEGQVSFADVVRAFNLMTQEGGLFFNMMDRQSQTVQGRWSAFAETVELGLRNMGLAFFEEFGLADMLESMRAGSVNFGQGEGVRNFFRDLKDGFDVVVGVSRMFGFAVGEGASAVRQFIEDLRSWARENEAVVAVISMMILTYATFKVAMFGLGIAVTVLSAAFAVLRAIMAAAAVVGGLTALVGIVSALLPLLIAAAPAVAAFVASLSVLYGPEMQQVESFFGRLFSGFGQGFMEGFGRLKEMMPGVIGGIRDAIAAGDIEGAWAIVMKALEYAFKVLLVSLRAEWKRFSSNLLDDIGADLLADIDKRMNDMRAWVKRNSPFWKESDEDINKGRDAANRAIEDRANAYKAANKVKVEAEIAELWRGLDPTKTQLDMLVGEVRNRAADAQRVKTREANMPQIETLRNQLMEEVWAKFNEDVEVEGPFRALRFWTANKAGGLESSGGNLFEFLRQNPWAIPSWTTGETVAGMPASRRGQRFELTGFPTGEQVDRSKAAQIIQEIRRLDPTGKMLNAPFDSIYPKTGAFKDPKTGMRVDIELSAAARDMAGDLRREFAKQQEGGIGTAGGQLDYFYKELGLLNEARYGPMRQATNALMSMTGVAGALGSPGIITQQEYEFGLIRNFTNLKKFAGTDQQDPTVRALRRGSSEAQDAVNKAQFQQVNLLEDIRNTFQRAEFLQKEQRDYQKALLEALQQYLKENPGAAAGGFFGIPIGR